MLLGHDNFLVTDSTVQLGLLATPPGPDIVKRRKIQLLTANLPLSPTPLHCEAVTNRALLRVFSFILTPTKGTL